MAGSQPKTDFDFNMLRAMEVFMAVVELRQVTAAADALGITQSAASQHLKSLESAFGVSLLDRTRRPLVLTHAGEVLQRRAFTILNEVSDLRSDIRHIASAAIPLLRVNTLASIATTLTPRLTTFVSEELEIPELSLSAGLASDHQTALNTRRCDVAITSEPLFDMSDFEQHAILTEPFFLVLPPDYSGPANDFEAVSSRLNFIRFSASAPVGRRTDQHLQRLRLSPSRAMEADRSSMVVAAVATGRGFAILSPSLLIDAVVEGMALRVVPLPFAGFSRTIMLIARKNGLGDIPARLAEVCTRELQAQFHRVLPALAPRVDFSHREAR